METGEEETRVVYMLLKILQLTVGSLDISQAEKKKYCSYKLSKFTKYNYYHSK
jgi:hypothetical protein